MTSKRRIFGDFHIHIGRTEAGKPVKISGARNLTFHNIVREANERKGIDMIGIIDAASPSVQADISSMVNKGELFELRDGGLQYERTTVILGCELEIKPQGYGPAHLLCYFPYLDDIMMFSKFLTTRMTNVHLSTQRFHGTVEELFERVTALNGIVIPAHVFTPYKSLYGSCANRLEDVLPSEQIIAVELGLSSDTYMADRLAELHRFTYLSNSDAHSLGKIGREYNEIAVNDVSYYGWLEALERENGAGVVANYGLDPRLGKYHRTFCRHCHEVILDDTDICPYCKGKRLIRGVHDRINTLAHGGGNSPGHRPPYIHQIPLDFIPGIGPKVKQKLLDAFGTEMHILHQVDKAELAKVVGETIAERIVRCRESKLEINEGAGGIYGKIID